jgi:hypothetical protein
VVVTLGELELRGTLLATGEDVEIRGDAKRNHPVVAPAVREALDRTVDEKISDWSFGIRFEEGYRYRESMIGWLRAAYLVGSCHHSGSGGRPPAAGLDRSGSESKRVASATATCSPRTGCRPAFSIRVYLGTKLQVSSTRWGRMLSGGKPAARRRWLAWRTLRRLRFVPPRQLRHLQGRPGPRDRLRRRLPAGTLARIPDELSAVEATPLMCAGITTYNSLRRRSPNGRRRRSSAPSARARRSPRSSVASWRRRRRRVGVGSALSW